MTSAMLWPSRYVRPGVNRVNIRIAKQYHLFDDRRDDDIIGAEEAHLLENLLFGAVADGKHGNDGRDAEEDA